MEDKLVPWTAGITRSNLPPTAPLLSSPAALAFISMTAAPSATSLSCTAWYGPRQGGERAPGGVP